MTWHRPLLLVVALGCAVTLAGGCRSGPGRPSAAGPTVTPSTSGPAVTPAVTPAGSPSVRPPAGCPSPAEVIRSMSARGWTGYRVQGRVVCDGDWATAHVRLVTLKADPARAVFRRVGGRLRALTYGTEGLCGAPGVGSVPPKIQRALGPYC
jgi:hypothetical protein